MTTGKLEGWLRYHMMVARILVSSKRGTVVFRVHREFIPYLTKHLEQYRPAGITFLYKRLRLWDYLFLRRKSIDVRSDL